MRISGIIGGEGAWMEPNLEFQSIGIGWMGFKLFVQMMRSWFNKHIFLGEIVCLRLDMTFNNPEQVACWCSGMKRELAKDIFCQWNTIQYTRYIYMHIAYIITGYIQIFVSIYTWTYTDHQVLQDVFLWIIFHAVILLPNFSRWISLGFPLVFRWFLGSRPRDSNPQHLRSMLSKIHWIQATRSHMVSPKN